jgi:Ni2+-binding GTPase involved in maturation of urease and hydrogenase
MELTKSIIIIYGRQSEGKTSTIKEACKLLLNEFPQSIINNKLGEEIDYNVDILLTIQINELKIGIESQGDPDSRMLRENSIENLLKDDNCDVVLCATRTKGQTVFKVDEIAEDYELKTIWKSSYYAPNVNFEILNKKAGAEIVELIKMIALKQI